MNGVREVPHDLPGDDEVEGAVSEFQVLGVHLDDVGGDPGLGAVLPGLGDHPVGVVYRGDVVPFAPEDDGEETRPASYVQDFQLLPFGIGQHGFQV